MRPENLVVAAVGLGALAIAALISWRWRLLPTTATPLQEYPTRRAAARDALMVLAPTVAAGVIAGFLVPGLVGRLVMRILGATSGDSAQGRLTEADEVVGEITLGGTLGFVIFVGIVVPVAASFLHLAIRRILPSRAWASGLVFGAVLLASIGVDDPLSPDNVDFRILRPLPLAIALVVATALLFGTTFAAVAARLERAVRAPAPSRLARVTYAALLPALLPPFVVFGALHVGSRALLRGRAGVLLDRPFPERLRRVLVGAASLASLAIVVVTATRIVDR